jgi:hypothetical protein
VAGGLYAMFPSADKLYRSIFDAKEVIERAADPLMKHMVTLGTHMISSHRCLIENLLTTKV